MDPVVFTGDFNAPGAIPPQMNEHILSTGSSKFIPGIKIGGPVENSVKNFGVCRHPLDAGHMVKLLNS